MEEAKNKELMLHINADSAYGNLNILQPIYTVSLLERDCSRKKEMFHSSTYVFQARLLLLGRTRRVRTAHEGDVAVLQAFETQCLITVYLRGINPFRGGLCLDAPFLIDS